MQKAWKPLKNKGFRAFTLSKCTRSVPHSKIIGFFVHFAMLPETDQRRHCPEAAGPHYHVHPGTDGHIAPEWFVPFRAPGTLMPAY